MGEPAIIGEYGRTDAAVGESMKTLVIVAIFLLILWQLGAGLYYLMVDKGETNRTAKALTRRIALSFGLIILVVVANQLGWIDFHGVGRAPG